MAPTSTPSGHAWRLAGNQAAKTGFERPSTMSSVIVQCCCGAGQVSDDGDALVPVAGESPRPSVTRLAVSCWQRIPSKAQRCPLRESFALGSAALLCHAATRECMRCSGSGGA